MKIQLGWGIAIGVCSLMAVRYEGYQICLNTKNTEFNRDFLKGNRAYFKMYYYRPLKEGIRLVKRFYLLVSHIFDDAVVSQFAELLMRCNQECQFYMADLESILDNILNIMEWEFTALQ